MYACAISVYAARDQMKNQEKTRWWEYEKFLNSSKWRTILNISTNSERTKKMWISSCYFAWECCQRPEEQKINCFAYPKLESILESHIKMFGALCTSTLHFLSFHSQFSALCSNFRIFHILCWYSMIAHWWSSVKYYMNPYSHR